MNLTKQEAESEVWKKLFIYFNSLIDGYHKDLEKSYLLPEDTAALRGRIKVLRLLLSMDGSFEQTLHPTCHTG